MEDKEKWLEKKLEEKTLEFKKIEDQQKELENKLKELQKKSNDSK
jgi:chaperonin cofactor prefoldin